MTLSSDEAGPEQILALYACIVESITLGPSRRQPRQGTPRTCLPRPVRTRGAMAHA